MNNKIIRRSKEGLYTPVGDYSHTTIIPAGMDTYVFSGQIGINKEGVIPEDFNDEVTQLFKNIKDLLDSESMTSDNITKVNIFSVDEIDWNYFYKEWTNLFSKDYPSMTIVYVKALGLPEIRIEIDIWSAK